MSSIYFEDDVFPTAFDKVKIQEDLSNIYNNDLVVHAKEVSDIAHMYALMESSVLSGGYDGKYLYIVAGSTGMNDAVTAFKSLLSTYSIGYVGTSDKVVSIPKKNSEVTFATYTDVVDGKYDYINATTIVVDLDYGNETKATLERIEPIMKGCLDFAGRVVGFLTDFDNLPTGTSSSVGTAGMFRMNDSNELEVYNGNIWILMKP